VKQSGTAETAMGHVVADKNADGCFEVQYHTDPRGQTVLVHESQVMHLSSFHPSVGSGVEVLHEGKWESAHIQAMPSDATKGLWACQCHSDPAGTITYCNDDALRPLLSDEEKAVVTGHLSGASTTSSLPTGDDFNKKLIDSDLGQFYPMFVDHGYDDATHIDKITDEELVAFGMKSGHMNKFHATFPRGLVYIVHNGQLNSTSAGLGYRPVKDLTAAVQSSAAWGSKVQGVEQDDGWLKVGTKYLPLKVDGKVVLYAESAGPPPEVEEATAKVEEAQSSGFFHSVAHMLHMDSTSPKAPEPNGGSPKVNSMGVPARGQSEAYPKAGSGSTQVIPERSGSLLHSFAHMLHLESDRPGSPDSPASTEKAFPARKDDFSPGEIVDVPKSAAKASSADTTKASSPIAKASPPTSEKESTLQRAEHAVGGMMSRMFHMS
jgi:hypothetical protein